MHASVLSAFRSGQPVKNDGAHFCQFVEFLRPETAVASGPRSMGNQIRNSSNVHIESVATAAYSSMRVQFETPQSRETQKELCSTGKTVAKSSSSERKSDQNGVDRKNAKTRTFTVDDDHAIITF